MHQAETGQKLLQESCQAADSYNQLFFKCF